MSNMIDQNPPPDMTGHVMAAFVYGQPATAQAAVQEAARLLGTAHMPVIAGLGTDIAGVRAAVKLAARIGGALDHMHADALLRDLDVMREAGMMVTTPSEARLRGDLLLLVGRSLADAPDMRHRLLAAPERPERPERRIVWLCPPRKADLAGESMHTLGRDAGDLPALLALLRARLNGHPVTGASRTVKAIDAVVAELKAARFGVAVWSAGELDALAVEMLCTLVDDLNAETRFTGLPLPLPDNARGVQEACAWLTGYPVRTGFARGYPEHDPWRFAADRLVATGEADCALWISAYGGVVPAWTRDLPVIALTAPGARFRVPPHVHVEVGRPGIDHDAVHHNPDSGTLMPATAERPSAAPSVAAVIDDILSALPEPSPC
jgi:formylmethanofuran dehydrogenase subunit B